MRAIVLEAAGQPLRPTGLPCPRPGPEQILLRVRACGVCRTDPHVLDGEWTGPKLPLVPGHESVGAGAERPPASKAGKACKGYTSQTGYDAGVRPTCSRLWQPWQP